MSEQKKCATCSETIDPKYKQCWLCNKMSKELKLYKQNIKRIRNGQYARHVQNRIYMKCKREELVKMQQDYESSLMPEKLDWIFNENTHKCNICNSDLIHEIHTESNYEVSNHEGKTWFGGCDVKCYDLHYTERIDMWVCKKCRLYHEIEKWTINEN